MLDKIKFWKKDKAGPSDQGGHGPDMSGLGNDMGGPFGRDSLSSTPGGPETAPPLGGTTPNMDSFPTNSPELVEPSISPTQSMRPQVQPQQGGDLGTLSKNIEIISSKMDALKAILDNLNQRIEHIEQIAQQEEEELPKRNAGW